MAALNRAGSSRLPRSSAARTPGAGRYALGLAVLLLLLLTLGCQAVAPRAQPAGAVGQPGGTLRVALPGEVVTLDPAMYTDTYSGYVSSQVNEPLFRVDFDQRIVPHLAERLEQPDATTYLITLRRGVTFHNGDELTADDVKFSFDRLIDPATASPRAWRLKDALNGPEDIQVLDRYTLKLVLKQPLAPFLERLTQGSSFILSRRALEDPGADPARRPVGTGPFRLVEWKSGDSVVLERNPSYWGEAPRVDRLLFRLIPDGQTRLAELESGGVDHLVGVPLEEVERLRADGRIRVLTAEALNVFYLGFNTRQPPLDNPALRQAVSLALDREELLSKLYDGLGQVAYQPLAPSSWAYNPEAERYRYDPPAAQQRLQAAGGPPGEPLELAYNSTAELTQVATRLQAQLADNLGLKVTLRPLEWGALLNHLQSGTRYQLFLLNWSGSADPDGTLFPLFYSKNAGAAGNRTGYRNKRVDELLLAAQRSVDQASRQQLYREAIALIQQDVPLVPIRHGIVSAAQRTSVSGFRLHPLNTQVFTGVAVD